VSINLGPLIVVPGVTSTVRLVNLGDIQAIKVSNGTPFDLTISGYINGSEIVPAGAEYLFHDTGQNRGQLNILPVNNVGLPGTGAVNVVAYQQNEQLPKGSWPLTIPTQIVQASTVSVPNLVNDGNAIGTQFLEVTPSGATSTYSFLNDGTVVIKSDQAGTLRTLIQTVPAAAAAASSVLLGDATRRVEVLGTFLADLAAAFSATINPNIASFSSLAGSVSGTCTMWMPFQGTSFKLVVCFMNNYQDASNRSVALPTAFVNYVGVFIPSDIGIATNGGFQLLSGVTVENLDVSTTVAAAGGSGTNQASIFKWSYGSRQASATNIDHIQVLLNTTAHNGIAFFFGS